MNCPHCGAECSESNFDAYPLYPKGNIVCGKCVFKVFAIKQDCRTTVCMGSSGFYALFFGLQYTLICRKTVRVFTQTAITYTRCCSQLF